ncbi:MAG: hypothetical protein H0U59_05350 [Gemmatimonadaceae bacterium]|nr:hypothetical protein [Gemmatimonadaceae bacterium]MDQ3244584.1 hypothetical protein [Gemmatimonadota bacterium]
MTLGGTSTITGLRGEHAVVPATTVAIVAAVAAIRIALRWMVSAFSMEWTRY